MRTLSDCIDGGTDRKTSYDAGAGKAGKNPGTQAASQHLRPRDSIALCMRVRKLMPSPKSGTLVRSTVRCRDGAPALPRLDKVTDIKAGIEAWASGGWHARLY